MFMDGLHAWIKMDVYRWNVDVYGWISSINDVNGHKDAYKLLYDVIFYIYLT